jgi:hypothetical protein
MSFNPFDAVGRFMLGGLDLDKNVMETGSKLAAIIGHRRRIPRLRSGLLIRVEVSPDLAAIRASRAFFQTGSLKPH